MAAAISNWVVDNQGHRYQRITHISYSRVKNTWRVEINGKYYPNVKTHREAVIMLNKILEGDESDPISVQATNGETTSTFSVIAKVSDSGQTNVTAE